MLQILGLRSNTKELEIKTIFGNLNILENLFLYWFIKIENLKAKLEALLWNNRKIEINKTEFHLLYFEILKNSWIDSLKIEPIGK